MRQRLTVLLLGVLGAVLIALGIASATVWRPDSVLAATTAARAGTTMLVTDPGVLSLAGNPVTVTASVPGSGPVVIAIGRDTDVTGWVGSDRVTHVTGLASWHTLAVATPTASPTASPTSSGPAVSSSASAAAVASPGATAAAGVPGSPTTAAGPDPTGSDMWVAQATGVGRATLTWPVEPGRWMLLVAATGADAAPPTVQLAWPQTVRTPWLVPGVVSGSILLILALVLLVRAVMRSRGGLAVTWNAIETGELARVDTPELRRTRGQSAPGSGSGSPGGPEASGPLTRRQLRERERTAPTPVVTPKLSLRRRDPEVPTGESTTPVAPPRVWEPEVTAPATGAVTSEASAPASDAGASLGASRTPDVPARSREAAPGDEHSGRRWRRDRAVPSRQEEPAPRPGDGSVPSGPSTVGTGAVRGPGTSAGPAADAHLASSSPESSVQPLPSAPGGGARADAWRRAWGFPGVGGPELDAGAGAGEPVPGSGESGPGATTDDSGRA